MNDEQQTANPAECSCCFAKSAAKIKEPCCPPFDVPARIVGQRVRASAIRGQIAART